MAWALPSPVMKDRMAKVLFPGSWIAGKVGKLHGI